MRSDRTDLKTVKLLGVSPTSQLPQVSVVSETMSLHRDSMFAI